MTSRPRRLLAALVAAAVVGVTLAVPTFTGAAFGMPAGDETGDDLGDEIVPAIDGYRVIEGTPPTGSGPLSAALLAQFGDLDPDELDGIDFQAYLRIFENARFGQVIVIGVEGPSEVTDDFRRGFELGATQAEQSLSQSAALFPGEAGTLGEIEYSTLGTTGFDQAIALVARDNVGFVMLADDPAGDVEALRVAVRAQHDHRALDGAFGGDGDDGKNSAAFKVGQAIGVLLLVGFPVLIILKIANRGRRTRDVVPSAYDWTPPPPPPSSPPPPAQPEPPPPG